MSALRFEKLPEVVRRTGLSRSTIYDRARTGKFPRPVPLGSPRAVAWVASEVDLWLEAQIAAREPLVPSPGA
jgi:prophage regulatory protein